MRSIRSLFRSVRLRLVAWCVLVLLCTLAAFGIVLRIVVERSLITSIDNELTARGDLVEGLWRSNALPDSLPPFFPPDNLINKSGSRALADGSNLPPRLLDAKGHSISPFDKSPPFDTTALRRVESPIPLYTEAIRQGEPLRIRTKAILVHGKVAAYVQTAYILTATRAGLDSLSATLLALVPVALLMVAAGAALLTGRLLAPVREMAISTLHIRATDLSERLPVADDEFGKLASAINTMLRRLEEAFERQKQFTSDASHELRTPLAAIKTYIGGALAVPDADADIYRRSLVGADKAATLMTHIVDDLLLLSRLEAAPESALSTTISTLVTDAVNSAIESLVARPHACIASDIQPTDLAVPVEAVHLTRLFLNLLENAARHTPADGKIVIAANVQNDRAVIRIADNGCGIAPEHLSHIGERFYRADTARARSQGGLGLGVAICRGIVKNYGGDFAIESEVGQGTTVIVTLPFRR